MTSEYQYRENPHKTERSKHGPATRANRAQQHHDASPASVVARFNNALGLRITNAVGSMWAAYLFAAIALVSLPAALASGNALVIISWIAQTFLQLVLLPIIIVGQNLQSRSADDRAIATYNDANAILHDAEEIQAHLDSQDARIAELLEKSARLEAKLERIVKERG